MSSNTKDPLDKQDTSTESSGSHSGSEVSLDNLKIEEQKTKEDVDETKLLDSPNQESSTTKDFTLDEPVAGSSGLQKLLSVGSDIGSIPESKDIGTSSPSPSEEATKEIAEILEEKMVEGHSDTTEDSPLFKQTSTGSVVVPPPIPDRPHPAIQLQQFGMAVAKARGLQLKRGMFAVGSADTSSDISEIRSEVADLSTEGSAYLDARESFERDNSPSLYEPAVESPSSEASDANISDLPEESIIISTSSTSLSISTPSGEQGHQAYLAMLEREANERGVPISTSSGIGSTNQSELSNLQRWGLAGEVGHYRPNLDIIDQEISESSAQGEEPQAALESMQSEEICQDQGMEDFDNLFQQVQNQEDVKDTEMVEIPMNENASQRQDEGKVDISKVGTDSKLDKKQPLSLSSDSSKEENVSDKQRSKPKLDIRKKEKSTAKTSSDTRQSSSESPEPKSSSSDEIQRKESPDIRSSSGTPEELSHSDKGKKMWQKPGQLRNMKLSTVLSKDSVITEEDEQNSPSESQNPELIDTKEVSPERMQITPEKDSAQTEQSESKPLESSDQGDVYEVEAVLREEESNQGVAGCERTAGKSKRPGTKLSTSPPSDEITSSASTKEGTSRPKKKARADKKRGKPRRTRHDSGGSGRRAVGIDYSKQEDSKSGTDSSDYTASDEELEEEETEL